MLKLKNNLLVFLLLGIFLISFASALDFDNWKFERDTTFDGIQVKDNSLLQKYAPLEIKNLFGWGKTYFEGYLSQHNETCGIDCTSTLEINLHQDGVLIDDIYFETLQKDGTWIKQDVRGYQFSYLGLIYDYETKCIYGEKLENGTIEQECNQIKVGSHKGSINYNIGEEVKQGIYTLKLDAQKKPTRTVDWKIKTQGKVLGDWAVWGASGDLSAGLVSQYIFNDNNQTLANDTQGNNDGTWNGYTFNDGTISGATLNTSGKYGSAYDFDGVDDYILVDSLNWTSDSYWVKNNGGVWKMITHSGDRTYVNGFLKCSEGMAYINKLGGYCIDKYEASTPGCENVGDNCGIYKHDSYCPNYCIPDEGIVGTTSGVGTTAVAYSKVNVAPLVGVSQYQARQLCANAGKHLCTDEEWLAAANLQGQVYDLPASLSASPYDCVVDSGEYCSHFLSNCACNTSYNKNGVSGCHSAEGVYDMVGNVWEWTNETATMISPESGWHYINTTDMSWSISSSADDGTYGKDGCYFLAGTNVRAVLRGGAWSRGARAGPFCAYLSNGPTHVSHGIGFRCCSS